MRLFEAILKGSRILNDSDTPQLDAEVILSNILGKDRTYLYLNRTAELSEKAEKEFFDLINRRRQGEPVQYITGKQEFMSLNFFVKPGVLIPRPDTEVLVEEVLKCADKLPKPIIVDVGCGSGAISVSIAKYKADSMVIALDIMDTPLEVTKLNADMNGVGERVRVIRSDLLKNLDRGFIGNVDVIVSNPPYIKDGIIPTLMKEVKDYEPYEALSGKADGLFFYRGISNAALNFLKVGGLLAYEIGYDQSDEVISILKGLCYTDIKCIKDLAGLDRVVTGRKW